MSLTLPRLTYGQRNGAIRIKKDEPLMNYFLAAANALQENRFAAARISLSQREWRVINGAAESSENVFRLHES